MAVLLLRKSIFYLGVVLIYSLLFSPLSQANEKNIVKFKNDSFEPNKLEINLDDEVTFINESNGSFWPASNIHPTHGIYPEFDPKKAIKKGKSWSFKFTKVGEWKYHDHLNPHIRGTVIARDNSSRKTQYNKILDFDLGQTTFFKFIKAHFLRIYYLVSPKKLPEDLESLDFLSISNDEDKAKFWLLIIGGKQYMDKLIKDTKGGSKVDCHQQAHVVGRDSFKLFGASVFNKINYGCHSGYLHGAMEAFIAGLGSDNLTSRTEKLCKRFKTDFSKFECLHGIGHGFTAYLDYDLPEALKMCGGLSDDYGRRSCFGGVFMENIMVAEGRGAIAGHKTKWINSDPHFPCNGVDRSYLVQFECYQMQTSRMLQLSSYNFNFIKDECLKAPSDMVSICFRSMGRDVAGQTLRDEEKILSICQIVPYIFFRECVTGALNVIIDFWGERVEDQPVKLCDRVANLPDKAYCFEVLGKRLVNIFGGNKGKIDKICNYADPAFLRTCSSGIN